MEAKTILLRIDPLLKEALKSISQQEKRTLSSLICKVLDDYAKSYKIKEEVQDGSKS